MSDIHNQREIENMQAEIDRLRQILENIQQARVSQGKAIIDANNEIERLRADNQKVALEYLGQIGQLSDENTRLRAALERIAFGKYHWEADAQEEARAALEGK